MHRQGNRTRWPLVLLLALAAMGGAMGGAVASAQEEPAPVPPTARETDHLVEEYFGLDGRTRAGWERQSAILGRLELLGPLKASRVKSWRKKLAKLWKRGPELEKKAGRHFLWEDEERGLFLLGGETKKPKGLFIGMHGGGVGSGDAWSAHGAFNASASEEDWLAIFPQVLEKTECGWTDSGTEEFVLELIERALRTWNIDRDRVFLGGHSMGGYGAWTLGGHHADLVAGLIPSAGGPTPIMNRAGEIIDIDEGIVPSLRNTSIVIYQSDDDPRVPPDANRFAVARLAAAREKWGGFDYEYWEVTGRGHGAPPGGYRALVEKIRDRRRTPRPSRVVWEQALDWKRQFYWLWCDEPVRGTLVVADLDREANTIRVTAAGKGRGFGVLLDEELVDFKREVVVECNGKEVFRGEVRPALSALVATAVHGDAARTYAVRISLP